MVAYLGEKIIYGDVCRCPTNRPVASSWKLEETPNINAVSKEVETITLQGFEYISPSWDHPRGNRWRGVFDDSCKNDYRCIVYAETPQDAACMLALAAQALVMLNAILRVSNGLPLL